MTVPNRSTLWGRTLIAELVKAGVGSVCFAPGSRSTPLVVPAVSHPELTTYSHLDERSCAFFALGQGRRTGDPTAILCTSGTAAANFHPAIIEADRGRVPLIVLTADRPPELADSGTNQTIDQEKLYGDAVRWYRDLPEPAADPRTVRSLRTVACRAVAHATGNPSGPVHLNARFPKPLAPTPVEGAVPSDFATDHQLAATGRGDEPYVSTSQGSPTLDTADAEAIAAVLTDADRGLVVAGPVDPPPTENRAIVDLATAMGAPLLADPLSGVRWGVDTDEPVVCGGYDGYLAGVDWFDPDVVVRFGAAPTSKALRSALRTADPRQYLVDPAASWREATFTATDLVVADPRDVARELAGAVGAEAGSRDAWIDRFATAEAAHWSVVDAARESETFEGSVLAAVAETAPDPSTVVVSNSMPVRDLDRFGRPHDRDLTVLGNRGASGIDGIISTALGAGSVTDDPLSLVTGDLAYYHDMNGLLALGRCEIDATIVVVNNDGGGIFHRLPIATFDPPFTEAFVTPHGLDFAPTGDLYDLTYRRVTPTEFADAYRTTVGGEGATVLEVAFDAADSHKTRDDIQRRVEQHLD